MELDFCHLHPYYTLGSKSWRENNYSGEGISVFLLKISSFFRIENHDDAYFQNIELN